MNEELRSATEELETSREELQSINEELTTVNQELKVKVDELSHANGDLQNLMAATAIATVFLDREPAHLALHAVGGRALQPDRRRRRPADQRPRQPARLPAAQRRRARRARHARADRARGPLRRALAARPAAAVPQRRRPDQRRRPHLRRHQRARRVSDALRESESLFRTIVTQAAAGVAHIDLDGRITLVNARFALIAGDTPERSSARRRSRSSIPTTGRRTSRRSGAWPSDGTPFEMEKRYVRGDGSVIWVSASVTAVLDAATGRPRRSRSSSTSATAATPSRRCASRRSGCA
jgi:two-component system CheB/CheR fusion protein